MLEESADPEWHVIVNSGRRAEAANVQVLPRARLPKGVLQKIVEHS